MQIKVDTPTSRKKRVKVDVDKKDGMEYELMHEYVDRITEGKSAEFKTAVSIIESFNPKWYERAKKRKGTK